MKHLGTFPSIRMRRLRQSSSLRNLVRETSLDVEKLILPLFIKYGSDLKNPIASMPGHFQWSLDRLPEILLEINKLGIGNIILFGIPAEKDPLGQDSYSKNGIIQSAIKLIKKMYPKMLIISDVCLCEYTDHGHCGVVLDQHKGLIDNDQSIELLAKQAVSHAEAGADIIAPSANMDGMVLAIRKALDHAGFNYIPILSYSVKYASALYGPFRQAAEGAPKFGDRSTYQMDYRNSYEAVRECALDIVEGADMLLVKPAHTYLDIIYQVKESHPGLPLGAYHTSGEFAMIKAAAEKGWIEERKCVTEVLTSIYRAGADFIISYYTMEIASWLRDAGSSK